MDVPLHVLRTLFRGTKFPLVQHHLDSYNDMIANRIPLFLRASNPHELELPDGRYIRVFLAGRDGTNFKWVSPTTDEGFAITPQICRLDNLTYELKLIGDIEIEYITARDAKPKIVLFKDVELGRIPLMLRSTPCYLTAVDGFAQGECKFELGGYFIIDGAEKFLLTQEALGNNMMYSSIRKRAKASTGLEAEGVAFETEFGYENPDEYTVGFRSVSEDASRGPFSHFLVIPAAPAWLEKTNKGVNALDQANLYQDKRLALITLPGFMNPVPLLSIFRALGLVSDRDIYETTLIGVTAHERLAYDDIMMQLLMSHDRILTESNLTDLDVLVREVKTRSQSEVLSILHEKLFPHLESEEDVGSLFRRKAYQLGAMLKMGIDTALGRTPPSDRDNFSFKRLNVSGELFFSEFRRIFREMSKSMLLELDTRIQYDPKFKGEGLVALVQPETINRFWRKYTMMNQFSKSFKGLWGKEPGVSQELSRLSYAGTISSLRRTNLNMDRTSNKKEPRRFHASQIGLMCPVDSPDGRNIGYTKSLAILAQVSTATPTSLLKPFIDEHIISLDRIHPSAWDPKWTPVFLNSRLMGACAETETFHYSMVRARRDHRIPASVSLAWNRVLNKYTVTCDAGRPIRPVYREGTTANDILKCRTWEEIAEHLDYLDATEMDTVRLSFAFHPKLQSEIHASFNLSALTNLIPFLDHNPGTRNAFAIAQTKQTCSWYHTNYTKRFDTVAIMLCNPQKPLTQTWMYNEIMGSGGCMPYGENVMVAVAIYGGFNQEDSVMLNASSMKRGMFQSLYWHSYDISESVDLMAVDFRKKKEDANYAVPRTSEFSDVRTDDIKRKEDANYDLLDSEGIIKIGSHVTQKTILVGMRTPIRDATGQVKEYIDSSVLPKKGQHGRVDAVYRYITKDGVRGVKLRIVEERYPVLGDKLGSRHSQKGTCGLVLDEEDMPFTASGQKPDLIFNPHALPTRMTIAHWIESLTGAVALDLGVVIDATPFTTSDRVKTTKEMLRALKFEPNGHQVLYNGMTGEMMESEIFVGPMYYQRMKQMVEDKINYRTTGPKTLLTHQPLEGRADDGGLRIGEMERDALFAHGLSKFTHESFMERSDKAEINFNHETGQFDASRTQLTVPYASTLFINELKSNHISITLQTA